MNNLPSTTADLSSQQSPSDQSQSVLEAELRAMIVPGKPLADQHDIKFLWHGDRLAHVLMGRPFDVQPVTMNWTPRWTATMPVHSALTLTGKNAPKRCLGARVMSLENMELVLQRMADGGVSGVIFTGWRRAADESGTRRPAWNGRVNCTSRRDCSPTEVCSHQHLRNVCWSLRRNSCASVRTRSRRRVYTRFHGLRDQRFADGVWENIQDLPDASVARRRVLASVSW